jgi:mannose/cellobiose epimerase-like protein (N-acyl-D-glucosamine 2-epimerase family)
MPARVPHAKPDFESRAFLQGHVAQTLAFYQAHAFDPAGGFFHYLRDDGTVYNRSHRHLVSATRWVFNACMAWQHTGQSMWRDWAVHALAHVDRFRVQSGPLSGLHVWTVQDGEVEDARIMAYGQAFVLLARSHAHAVGLCTAGDVAQAFDRMGEVFYNDADQAYADELGSDGMLSDYRGQNANMHMCEACLAAYASTGEARYLQRAQTLIQRFAYDLAAQSEGLIWEHYHRDWSIDWDHNKDKPGDIFKPWGFQTGHQTEWAKLLLAAHQLAPRAGYVQRAVALQNAAWQYGWDKAHGGLVYGFAPDYLPCDRDKYFWVQAESLASAWRLWRATGDETFREQYHQLWAWSWQHLIDHTHGAWFRVVGDDGHKLEDTKSPAGKVDYHTLGACWDVMGVGGLRP